MSDVNSINGDRTNRTGSVDQQYGSQDGGDESYGIYNGLLKVVPIEWTEYCRIKSMHNDEEMDKSRILDDLLLSKSYPTS